MLPILYAVLVIGSSGDNKATIAVNDGSSREAKQRTGWRNCARLPRPYAVKDK